jgi:hypothetical protein
MDKLDLRCCNAVFCSIQQQEMRCTKSRGDMLATCRHPLTSLVLAAPGFPR